MVDGEVLFNQCSPHTENWCSLKTSTRQYFKHTPFKPKLCFPATYTSCQAPKDLEGEAYTLLPAHTFWASLGVSALLERGIGTPRT